MALNGQKTISAIRIRGLAYETEIRLITAKIWPEIVQSAIAKRNKLSRKSRRVASQSQASDFRGS
jgi:hypothetical protein